jgi:hypothetical protein
MYDIETGKSEVQDPLTHALPSIADAETDLGAQSGTWAVSSKSSHHCSCPTFLWVLSHTLGISPMQGGGSKGQGFDIPQSVRDANEDVLSHASIPIRSQVDIETQAHSQENIDQGVYVPSTTGSLHDLMQHEANNPPINDGHYNGGSNREPAKMRMIGDFDDGANALWTLYGKEAKSYDQSRIQTLKEDMDGVLIFVRSLPYSISVAYLIMFIHHPKAGLFSTALTAFIVNSIQSLQSSPAQQTAYYMQQNVAMLAQISQQLSTIAPQVAIPPTPPPSFPTFKPLASDIHVNVFWFMALVFSLSAALLAILVQQWVRDYMHVFQRYSDSLKSARLRQYLYEGCEGWYMPVLAEAVPGLLHVSLFLFFAGLVEFVTNINTTVGVSTTAPIGICGLFYIFTMFAPVINPQSPYQNSFSGLIWYVIQKFHGRRYRIPGSSGASKSVSPNMAEGQMQLAMEETEGRKTRDGRAVSWLVDNLTADAEVEPFLRAIPGSFNTEWGIEVWKGVSEPVEENKSTNQFVTGPRTAMNCTTLMTSSIPARQTFGTARNPISPISRLVRVWRPNVSAPVIRVSHPLPRSLDRPTAAQMHVPGNSSMRELSRRVGHLLKTCNNHGHFASEELRRERTRACVETIASLVSCANADLGWFGEIRKVLRDIGVVENINKHSMARLDQSFVARYACLSIVAIRPALRDSSVRSTTSWTASRFALFSGQDGTVDDRALEAAKKIDGDINQVWGCLRTLDQLLFDDPDSELTLEQMKEKLRSDESQTQISELERNNIEAIHKEDLDWWIFYTWRHLHNVTEDLTCQLPGVQFDAPQRESAPFSQVLHHLAIPTKPLFVLPCQQLRGLCSIAPKLRDIIEERNVEEHQTTLDDLKALRRGEYWIEYGHLLMESQLAQLQDLRDGGGLGVAVELFFITLEQVLPKFSLEESQYALYLGTFKNITSDWEQWRHSSGTQKVILNVVYNIAMRLPEDDIPSDSHFACPPLFTDELLILLSNMLEGQTGSHISDIEQRIHNLDYSYFSMCRVFVNKVLDVISQT